MRESIFFKMDRGFRSRNKHQPAFAAGNAIGHRVAQELPLQIIRSDIHAMRMFGQRTIILGHFRVRPFAATNDRLRCLSGSLFHSSHPVHIALHMHIAAAGPVRILDADQRDLRLVANGRRRMDHETGQIPPILITETMHDFEQIKPFGQIEHVMRSANSCRKS